MFSTQGFLCILFGVAKFPLIPSVLRDSSGGHCVISKAWLIKNDVVDITSPLLSRDVVK